MTHWLPLALLTALALSVADVLSKKALARSDDEVIAWVREGYALPFLAAGLLFIPAPALDWVFWKTVAVLLPLEVIGLILYVKAIRLSPLSLSVPFMALSPVFIIFFAFVFLGEWPSRAGVAGIIMIAAGAYLLNASAARTESGLWGPVKAAFKEPGSLLMMAVAVIYGVTSTLGKVAVQHSSPVFFGFFYPFLLALVMTAYLTWRAKIRLVVSRPGVFLPIGLCSAVMVMTHFLAINLTQVAYMISVKRTSLVWSVIFGAVFFKEVNIRERLLGAAVMLAGVALIALF
ncbi:MAG: EamA family transporter [Deltaproteobacteria bacterium]|nr:EamA family transporter [Deltaproteobacteria bacterium]